jgi:hypothetical protein
MNLVSKCAVAFCGILIAGPALAATKKPTPQPVPAPSLIQQGAKPAIANKSNIGVLPNNGNRLISPNGGTLITNDGGSMRR